MSAIRSSLPKIKLTVNKKEDTGQAESVIQNSEQSGQSSNQASSPVRLELPWDTRHRIIKFLDKLSLPLLRANVSAELKEKVLQKTNDLMTRLIGLRLAASDTQRDEQRPSKRQRTGESGESEVTRQPFFEISFRLRSEIVDQLFCNLDATMYRSVGSDESRKRIVDENAYLNMQLLELLPNVRDGTSDESDPFNEPQSRMIDQKIDEVVGTLRIDLDRLREQVQAIVPKPDASKSEMTIDYELKVVSGFFGSIGERFSEDLIWSDCSWSIMLRVYQKKESAKTVQYLGFFLNQKGDLKDEINVWCEFRLLATASNVVVKKNVISCLLLRRSFHGFHYFISYDDLKRKEYIQNDRLKVQIYLRVVNEDS